VNNLTSYNIVLLPFPSLRQELSKAAEHQEYVRRSPKPYAVIGMSYHGL